MQMNPNFNNCRLCGEWECSHLTGPMLKYSVRHYAHARCGCSRWGVEWLDKQPTWIVQDLPWTLVATLGIEWYVRGRIASATPQPHQEGPEAGEPLVDAVEGVKP